MKACRIAPLPTQPTIRPDWRLGTIALGLCLLLSACSRAPEATTAATAPPTYAAVARGRIDIEGGLLALSMPREGTLSKVAVHEGDHVKQGQLLAQLDDGLVVGRAFMAAVIAVVVVGAVAILFAVGLVVFLVVAEQVHQGEPVMDSDMIDARLR